MKKVTIIYKTIPHYRKDFYNKLRFCLAQRDIELNLLYGQPSKRDSLKKDTIDIEWAIKIRNHIFEIKNYEFYWQPVFPYLKDVDLIIVEQASKLLVNYILLLYNLAGKYKLAYWGHGKNFQETSANKIGEWIKSIVSKHVHWWFAYNKTSANIVENLGFIPQKITVVQNAIDTQSMTRIYNELSIDNKTEIRKKTKIFSNHVGIYSGGLYKEKRLPFLLNALKYIRQNIPDFEMIFIGDGVEAQLIKQAAEKYDWIHYVGPKFDRDKILYFSIANLFLMPGLIGLSILDTFALETPLVTTNVPIHSPEIEYLDNGINGLMLNKDTSEKEYAQIVTELLLDTKKLDHLINGCRISRSKYTIDNMVHNFSEGIISALQD